VLSFTLVFPTKTLYTPLLSPILATCRAYLILLKLIIQVMFGEEYRSLSSSLCSFLHSPVTLCLLGPNILFDTLNLCSLSVSNQVLHLYKTTGKISSVYLSLYFWTARWKTEDSVPNDSKHSLLPSSLNFFLNRILIY